MVAAVCVLVRRCYDASKALDTKLEVNTVDARPEFHNNNDTIIYRSRRIYPREGSEPRTAQVVVAW